MMSLFQTLIKKNSIAFTNIYIAVLPASLTPSNNIVFLLCFFVKNESAITNEELIHRLSMNYLYYL